MEPFSQQVFLRDAMAMLGMTRAKFAARLGVGLKTLDKWMAPAGSDEYRALSALARNYVADILKWEATNPCHTPNGGITSRLNHSHKGSKVSLKNQLLDAVLDGRLGRGLIVTRQDVIQAFPDEAESYTSVLLSNAEMETATHSPTWDKFTQRVDRGVYRIHPEALGKRLAEREAQAAREQDDSQVD